MAVSYMTVIMTSNKLLIPMCVMARLISKRRLIKSSDSHG
jgi:hypothetical protein